VTSITYGHPTPAENVACALCRNPLHGRRICMHCGQLAGYDPDVRLSSVGRRFGGYLLEGVLVIVTLVIGWLIWGCFTFGKGQTPAKQLLGMRVVDLNRGRSASWGVMFGRELLKGLVSNFAWLLLLVPLLWLVWDEENQELWDKALSTVVVDDGRGLTLPPTFAAQIAAAPAFSAPPSDTSPLAIAPSTKTCPACAEPVKAAARVCRFCGHRFEG
jgi:uncharacterized RDD family membrane protein YckC